MSSAEPRGDCPLCKRPIYIGSDHHLIPKSRGGKADNKLPICSDCHRTIHAFFTNKQLEKEYNTVEALMSDERLRKAIRWLSKRNPKFRSKTKTAKDKKRGRGD